MEVVWKFIVYLSPLISHLNCHTRFTTWSTFLSNFTGVFYPLFYHFLAFTPFSSHALTGFFSGGLPGAQDQIEVQASGAKL